MVVWCLILVVGQIAGSSISVPFVHNFSVEPLRLWICWNVCGGDFFLLLGEQVLDKWWSGQEKSDESNFECFQWDECQNSEDNRQNYSAFELKCQQKRKCQFLQLSTCFCDDEMYQELKNVLWKKKESKKYV